VLVGFQRLTELTEQPVVNRDVAPDIQRALMIYSPDNLKFVPNAQVKRQRLAELAVCAQVRTVDGLAQQERLEPVTIDVPLQQGADPQDQLVGIGRAATDVHGDGDLHGQGQHLEVVLAEAFPPHVERVLAEPHRLDMAATQVQSPDLVDDELTQFRILGTQEPVFGLEVLQGKVIDLVIASRIRVTGV